MKKNEKKKKRIYVQNWFTKTKNNEPQNFLRITFFSSFNEKLPFGQKLQAEKLYLSNWKVICSR